MLNEQLECCLEEEVAYGCTPHDVLNALERLQTRLDQHRLDEPGEYRQTKPTAIWHSSLTSAWMISMSLFRAPARTEEPVLPPTSVLPVAERPADGSRGFQPTEDQPTNSVVAERPLNDSIVAPPRPTSPITESVG